MSRMTLLAAALSLGMTALLGLWIIPWLRRLKYGQTILDIGPKWHKNKQGTPTMGGLMFIVGVILAVTVSYTMAARLMPTLVQGHRSVLGVRLVAGLLMALGFALIGFADDYVKVAKKRNLGLTAGQKLIVQFIVAGLYLWSLWAAGDLSTVVQVPFLGQWHLGWAYWPLCAVGIVYLVNSVNLTDGLDGLASSVTFMCALGFLLIANLLDNLPIALLAAAVAGGCLGFLIYNAYPAKVFMGDTGSMFLGGCVVAMAFGVGLPLFLGLTGIIYLCESLSVILQVISFKTTGKRIFKMSPIHHHFEMSGYSEVQIVSAFTAITLVGSALAYWAVHLI
ncbi:MAG: phospho-N-acetylmuramoyl-pentapeptide-transferase [Oscillospiraceae bacterium]